MYHHWTAECAVAAGLPPLRPAELPFPCAPAQIQGGKIKQDAADSKLSFTPAAVEQFVASGAQASLLELASKAPQHGLRAGVDRHMHRCDRLVSKAYCLDG